MIQQIKPLGVVSELIKEGTYNDRKLSGILHEYLESDRYTPTEVKELVETLQTDYNAPIYKHRKWLSFNWTYKYRKGASFNFCQAVIYKVNEVLFDTIQLLEEHGTEI